MRRIIVLISALLFAISILATPAVAHHQHEVVHTHPVTGNERVLQQFPCEPAHIAVDPHPRHYGLHAAVVPGVGADRGDPGPITVRAIKEADPCPTA